MSVVCESLVMKKNPVEQVTSIRGLKNANESAECKFFVITITFTL
jgi:hypothetical protein